MAPIQKNIKEANRFKSRNEQQHKAQRFRFLVILGITVGLILVVIAWYIVI